MRTEVKKIELVRDGVGCQVMVCIRWKSTLGVLGTGLLCWWLPEVPPKFCDSLELQRGQHIVVLTAMTYYSKDTEQNQYRKKGTLGKIWRKPV